MNENIQKCIKCGQTGPLNRDCICGDCWVIENNDPELWIEDCQNSWEYYRSKGSYPIAYYEAHDAEEWEAIQDSEEQ